MSRLIEYTLSKDLRQGDILTLLIDWNHINENYQVVRVEGGSYEWLWFEIYRQKRKHMN